MYICTSVYACNVYVYIDMHSHMCVRIDVMIHICILNK